MEKPCCLRSRAGSALRLAALLALLAASLAVPRSAAADPVTEWAVLADRISAGAANWHTLAVMHRAMHDVANAALPIYERWYPPAPDEPTGLGAVPQAAMAAAAHEVVVLMHPARRAEADRLLRDALARVEAGETREAGVVLGRAVGAAAVARRRDDGYNRRHPFPASAAPGRWRPTPPDHVVSGYTETRPFLFRDLDDADPLPPPAPGSEEYQAGVETTRRLGALVAPERTEEQTGAALFWAYNLLQRGFVHLAARLLDEHPRPLGLAENARIMAQVSSAMADSAVLVWAEKARYSFWRPITTIRKGGFGVESDPEWRPLIETPSHPDHSAGHAADCATGAAVLQAVFGREVGSVTYAAQLAPPPGRRRRASGFAGAGGAGRRHRGTALLSQLGRGGGGARSVPCPGGRALSRGGGGGAATRCRHRGPGRGAATALSGPRPLGRGGEACGERSRLGGQEDGASADRRAAPRAARPASGDGAGRGAGHGHGHGHGHGVESGRVAFSRRTERPGEPDPACSWQMCNRLGSVSGVRAVAPPGRESQGQNPCGLRGTRGPWHS